MVSDHFWTDTATGQTLGPLPGECLSGYYWHDHDGGLIWLLKVVEEAGDKPRDYVWIGSQKRGGWAPFPH